MNIKIKMTNVDPKELRANGETRVRGQSKTIRPDILSRRGYATAFDLEKGEYTYVFGVDQPGKCSLVAINMDTEAEIGDPKDFVVQNIGSILRYHFKVSK